MFKCILFNGQFLIMMRILALETSTEYCSVALWQDGNVVSRCELVGQRHSELLIGILDNLLHEVGVKLTELDGIAFAPGRVHSPACASPVE